MSADVDFWGRRILPEEKRKNDVRTEYDRDLARLIHSAAFRRLQAKTQVLGLGESDFYRTRLTHSMEVAQIGTGILSFLNIEKNENQVDFPNNSLMMAICLAHDIGHPPFGHGGESALNFCMKDYGGFEGNAQTLRILSKLENYTENNGLNPTRRMMLGILKYPVRYSDVVTQSVYEDGINKKGFPRWQFNHKKMKPPKCFYDEEKSVVDFIIKEFKDEDKASIFECTSKEGEHKKPNFKSFDTSIMELADDISYTLHDLEDAVSLGLINKDDWNDHFSSDEKNKIIECIGNENYTNHDIFYKDLFGVSYRRKQCIGMLVNFMITNTIFLEKNNFSQPIMQFNVTLKEDVKTLRNKIQKLVEEKVIFNENVQQLEFKGQKMVVELFDVFDSDPKRLLPEKYKEKWSNANGEQQKKRVICDYISGMTDEYATKLYEKIFHPKKGSIFDKL